MKLIYVNDYEEMSKVAAEKIAEEINRKTNIILGLATGSTPLGLYRNLIEMNKDCKVSFSNVTTFNLDEYVGLFEKHNQSYRYFMNNNFFNHININIEKTFVPNGLAKDIAKEGVRYDKLIDELGGIDVQLLGIGTNGHIAFNEPDSYLIAGTHLAKLTESTIKANARFFNSIDEVPKEAITMGLGQIMKAKKIILLASGEEKAEAVEGMLSKKITTLNPATMLQMHKDVTVILDKGASKYIK